MGNIVMVLVVLTEHDPVEAVKRVITRWAYAIVLLSVILIKYFPELSRSYDRWTGSVFYAGVGYDKNALGYICLISGFFFVWNLVTVLGKKNFYSEKKEVVINVLFLLIVYWLMLKAQSSTSLGALISGIFFIAVLGFPSIRQNRISVGSYLALFSIVGLILFTFVDVQEIILKSLKRDPTLTGRTELWKTLIDMGTNPLIGVGYESFWLGSRAKQLWETYWWHPNQAHNGYLEIYLNLGAMGLFFFVGIIIAAYRNSKKLLVSEFDFGRFQMAFLGVFLLYNFTEATFTGLHPVWFVFLLIEMKWQRSVLHPLNNAVQKSV